MGQGGRSSFKDLEKLSDNFYNVVVSMSLDLRIEWELEADLRHQHTAVFEEGTVKFSQEGTA